MAEMLMPDYRTMYDRDYIGHFDLPSGNDLTLTIKRVIGGELVAMGGRKSKKPIVHFQEEGIKPLICNKTNSKTIATMYGNMTEGWIGKRISLFVSTTRSPDGSGEVECIRIRPRIPDSRVTTPDRVAAEPQDLADDIETVIVTHPTAARQPRTESPPSSATGSDAGAAATPDGYITPDDALALEARCNENGIPISRLRLAAKVERLSQIKRADFERAQFWIDRAIVAKAKEATK